jgi:hypothetical protein
MPASKLAPLTAVVFQVDAPPAGFVDVRIWPLESRAAHRVVVGHERPDRTVTYGLAEAGSI